MTVVLPVLNGAGRLERALEGLSRQDFPKASFEVIVADGRSRDTTVEIAKSFGCRVVDNPGITVAAGRNVGVEHARGELIAFSEDDIVLPPNWLSSAVRLLTEHGVAGVGGPTPIPAHSSLWSHAVNAVFRLASERGASVQSDRTAPGLVDDLPGGNSLYSATALRAVGPIDERLTTAEDVAMHHEFRRRGWRLRLCPELAAEHHKRDSVLGFFRQIQRFAIGRVQLWRRWSGALSAIHWLCSGVLPAALVVAWGVGLSGIEDGLVLIALLVVSLALAGVLMAVRQGERLPVALLFPLAIGVFATGWGIGFWSELALPSRDARRVGVSQKISDILDDQRLDGSRSLHWLLGTFIVLEGSLLAMFSQRAPFIMDEFQQGGYARHIDSGYYSTVVPFKTVLFTYVYYLPRLWLDSARDLLLAQRAETVALVVATMGISYAISRELGRTKAEAAVVVATTLAFSTFFEHCISLRAEPSALLLGQLALYAVVAAAGRERARSWYLMAGLALGGAFFCTQKAIWFCAAVGLATVIGAWVDLRSRLEKSLCPAAAAVLERSALLFGGFLLVGVAYCFAFSPATAEQVFRGVFLRSARFAQESSSAYGDMSRFIVQTLERSWWLFAHCALGLVVTTTRVGRDGKRLLCWVAALSMGGFVLSWKEPWPYTFTWWIPMLALFSPDALRIAAHGARVWVPQHASIAMLVFVLALLVPGLPRTIEALRWDNQVQLEMVERVESLLAPGESYQDGIGMISTRALAGLVWWDVPAISRILEEMRRGQNAELARAFRDPPKLLILNYRLQKLERALQPFIERSYVPVDGGLLVAGAELRGGKSPVEVRWEGRYALVDQDGRSSNRIWFVDGEGALGPVNLARGTRHIVAPECSGCFIVPDDLVGKVIPASTATPVRLFERPYTR